MVSSMNTKAARARKQTLVDIAPLTLAAVHGHVWAESYGQSPTDATTEARWRRERAERITMELAVVT